MKGKKTQVKPLEELLSFPYSFIVTLFHTNIIVSYYWDFIRKKKKLSLRKALGASKINLLFLYLVNYFYVQSLQSACAICITDFSILSEN